MRDEEILASSLADLDRSGDDVSTYLSQHVELPSSVQAALRAVEWLQQAPRPTPSPEFRDRARRNFAARVGHAERSGEPFGRFLLRVFSPFPLRAAAVPLAAALFVAVGTAGLYTASAAALPNMPLYSAKLAFDEIRVFTAFTPEQKARAHLAVADERLGEAQVERQAGRTQAASQLLSRYGVEEAQAEDSVDVAAPATAAPAPRSAETPSVAPTASAPEVSGPEVAQVQVPPHPRSGAPPASLPAAPSAPRSSAQAPTRSAEPAPARAAENRSVVAPARARPAFRPSAPSAPTNEPSPTNPPPPTNTAPPTSAPLPTNTAPPPTDTLPRPTPAPATSPSNPDSGALLRLLVLQASQGDPAAAVTLDLYIKSLPSTRAAGSDGLARLRVQRAALVAVFERIPTAQRPTIARAIAAVDAAIASGRQSSATDLKIASATPSPARLRPHPATRVPHLGNTSSTSTRRATSGIDATAVRRAGPTPPPPSGRGNGEAMADVRPLSVSRSKGEWMADVRPLSVAQSTWQRGQDARCALDSPFPRTRRGRGVRSGPARRLHFGQAC